MKILLPGGTGQIGLLLARHFHERGDEVVVLSRKPKPQPWREVAWDGKTLGDWPAEFENADAVINLAGRSVNCRYTPENRREIMDSRIDSVKAVGQAIAQAKNPPRVWLQMSTATIYSHRYDAPNDEHAGILGGNEPNAPDTWKFSIEVATSWERATEAIETPWTRKVLLRSAMMMSPERGGVFDTLLGLTRWGLGGTIGDGRQFMSWIYDADFVCAVEWLIAHDKLNGPVNLAAPNPLPQAEFMAALRSAWGAWIGLPATEWMLEIGTWLMQSESELILKSRRVIPTRLVESGFVFQQPEWPSAAKELCDRWRGCSS